MNERCDGCSRPPPPKKDCERPKPGLESIRSMVDTLTGGKLDINDIVLLLVLFLLYADSGDEDYLVMLIVLALNL